MTSKAELFHSFMLSTSKNVYIFSRETVSGEVSSTETTNTIITTRESWIFLSQHCLCFLFSSAGRRNQRAHEIFPRLFLSSYHKNLIYRDFRAFCACMQCNCKTNGDFYTSLSPPRTSCASSNECRKRREFINESIDYELFCIGVCFNRVSFGCVHETDTFVFFVTYLNTCSLPIRKFPV